MRGGGEEKRREKEREREWGTGREMEGRESVCVCLDNLENLNKGRGNRKTMMH